MAVKHLEDFSKVDHGHQAQRTKLFKTLIHHTGVDKIGEISLILQFFLINVVLGHHLLLL
jgi:hypothetical protein